DPPTADLNGLSAVFIKLPRDVAQSSLELHPVATAKFLPEDFWRKKYPLAPKIPAVSPPEK
ncbi:MAG: hypothetical protein M0033_05250, partial [Nitrospiraceae bacterium]|nr:hypothetical protein [Nitrospiraceae bacterium]